MFERNHNLVPEIDPEHYELELLAGGKADEDPIVLTLDELKSIKPAHTVMATIACAGSRRTEMQAEFPTVKGLKWTTGALGNANYTGVRVRDILLTTMGKKEEELTGKGLHLIAISYDADFQGKCYEVSIPIEDALNPLNEVTLAYEMNGADIPAVHGYPVRLICPGYIGVRSAKWVNKLIISKEEADSTPQRRDYKMVKDKDMSTVQWHKYKPINGQVLNSCVASPTQGEEVTLS